MLLPETLGLNRKHFKEQKIRVCAEPVAASVTLFPQDLVTISAPSRNGILPVIYASIAHDGLLSQQSNSLELQIWRLALQMVELIFDLAAVIKTCAIGQLAVAHSLVMVSHGQIASDGVCQVSTVVVDNMCCSLFLSCHMLLPSALRSVI